MRRILRIAPSFISRVTNVDVLGRARVQRFCTLIEDRQRKLDHKIQWHVPSAFSKILVCDNFGQPKIWFGHGVAVDHVKFGRSAYMNLLLK